jgi:hypothetical protein
LPWSHHRLSSCLSTGLNQSAFTVSTSKFFNRIGQKRQIRDVRAMSASLPTPDILLSRSKRRSGPKAVIGCCRLIIITGSDSLGLVRGSSAGPLTFRAGPNEAHIARGVTPRNPTRTLLDYDRICMSEDISWNAD